MSTLASLSNDELIARLSELRAGERRATAEVIRYLAEVDRRRLYLDVACSSLHSFCIERLGYSEEEATKRMRVARLCARMPRVIDELETGGIHLTGLFVLSNVLTDENADALLAEARGKTRREIEAVLARWFPQPDVLPMIVPVPASREVTCPGTGDCGATGGAVTASVETPRPRIEALSAHSFRVELTASAELRAKIDLAQNLLSHVIAPGDLPRLIERALDALIETETKRRLGAGKARKSRSPRPRQSSKPSRHVPVEVAREVWDRDGRQCTFVDAQGRRCGERRFLTLEHRDPFARGGPATVENLCVLCTPHNQESARRVFGEEHVDAKRRASHEAAIRDKTTRALVGLGFRRKQAVGAIDELERRGGTRVEVEPLLRGALALLVP
jgi:hypothetical protein